MKIAGDILSALFDEGFVKKAHGYSKFFDSWTDITAKNGIAAAAAHSRIKNIDRGVVLIEMDHPGWKQILQTKQTKLLNDFRIRFPDMDISGISLMLGKGESQPEERPEPPKIKKTPPPAESPEFKENIESVASYIDAIKDDELREKLIKLGQTVKEA